MPLPSDIALIISSKKTHGRHNISLMQGEKTLLTGRVNPHESSEIDAFILRVEEQLPGLKTELDEIRQKLMDAAKPVTKRTIRSKPNRLAIKCNGCQLHEIVGECLTALSKANIPPRLYVSNRKIVRIAVDENKRHSMVEVDKDYLRGELTRCADFFEGTEGGDIDVVPPSTVILDVLSRDVNEELRGLKLTPFPKLIAVVETPIMRSDGTILSHPGYDLATSMYYAPRDGFVFDPVPDKPTEQNIRESKELILECIGQFPFEGDTDKVHAIAALITPAIRAAVGLAPICIFDAPQAGTGKSLLASVIHAIYTGEPGNMVSCPDNDEEWRKLLTSLFMEGRAIVVFDNLDGPLFAGALARAITSPVWVDRKLGTNDNTAIINIMTVLLTGNNVEVKGDMPRRCYRCRLNAKSSRPWNDGREFKHANLIQWVIDNRAHIIRAILIICRAWHASGKPDFKPPRLGSFEAWSMTLGNILSNVGINGFLTNVDELYEQADTDTPQWVAFLSELKTRYVDAEFSTNQIAEEVLTNDKLRDCLPEFAAGFVRRNVDRWGATSYQIAEPGKFKIRLGKAMREKIDRRYGDDNLYLVCNPDGHKKIQMWQVCKV